jgi:putative two-component system response regulator
MANEPKQAKAKILIVDDMLSNLELLSQMLRMNGYETYMANNGSLALTAVQTDIPDLVLLDINMPEMSGYEVCEHLKTQEATRDIPVIFISALNEVQNKVKGFGAGGVDYITKPFQMHEMLARVETHLRLRRLQIELEREIAIRIAAEQAVRQLNAELEERVRARTRELEAAQIEILERLAIAGEQRDTDTGEHTYRVGNLSAQVAEQLGFPSAAVETIRLAARLHDIGKIGIPDGILLKPGRLTESEFSIMTHHTLIGAAMLAGSTSRFVQMAEKIALSHHEYWNGTGYPHNLAGEAIPIEARIVTVVDVFDALIHQRPYKPPWPRAEALAEIKRCAGVEFDARVVAAFLAVIESTFTEHPA